MFYIDVDLDLPKQLQCAVDKTLCCLENINLVDKTLCCLENINLEVVALSSCMKKMFLSIFQNWENTCAGVSFLRKLQARSVQLH